MPSPANAKLPSPKDPTEFENICLDALRVRWRDPNAERHGRSGQAQKGVDIFTTVERVRAAQCKNRETLTSVELTAEIAAARQFRPTIAEYVFVIAGPRDADLQAIVNELSLAEQSQGSFSIHIMFWEDVVGEISKDLDLVRKHWTGWGQIDDLPDNAPGSLEQFRQENFGRLEAHGFERYLEPDWYVCQPSESDETWRAFTYLRVRVFSPGLSCSRDLEPEDEEAFLGEVKRLFCEPGVELVPDDGSQVRLERRPADLRFHRVWGWHTSGCVGFSTTLEGTETPGAYSVPGLIADVGNLLALGAVLDGGWVRLFSDKAISIT